MSGDRQWALDASDGELVLHTGVAGTASRMGHRLTIAVRSWHATVRFAGEEPSEVELTVDVDSLEVVRGEGGVTPLSGPEKSVVRANALKSLRAERYPQIRFHSSDIEPAPGFFHLAGTLEICGRTGHHTVDVRAENRDNDWHIQAETDVRHTDYGVKPYSTLMGAMKVADEVHVTFTATHADN